LDHNLDNNIAILIVDEEESVCRLVKEALHPRGFQVLSAADGLEGLRLFREHAGRIRLVITGTMMPKMTGIEMAEQIRSLSSDMKIIFMSRLAAGSSILKSLRERCYFLPKPLSQRHLLSSVEQVMSM
jgi:DNA-binding response OmpR family regulator